MGLAAGPAGTERVFDLLGQLAPGPDVESLVDRLVEVSDLLCKQWLPTLKGHCCDDDHERERAGRAALADRPLRRELHPRVAQRALQLADPAPPRFAQGVGLAFALVALVAFTSGLTLLGQVAIGFALVAALLNAVFAFCLGCEVYLLVSRLLAGARRTSTTESARA